MEWLDRIRASIDYIEANLDNEIDFTEVAKKAYCSVFHFHRMFSILTGVSTVEYVRRRRLTLAAQEFHVPDHNKLALKNRNKITLKQTQNTTN